MFCDERWFGQMTIECVIAASSVSSFPRIILLIRSMPGESSPSESDIALISEVGGVGVWVGLLVVGSGWALGGLV